MFLKAFICNWLFSWTYFGDGMKNVFIFDKINMISILRNVKWIIYALKIRTNTSGSLSHHNMQCLYLTKRILVYLIYCGDATVYDLIKCLSTLAIIVLWIKVWLTIFLTCFGIIYVQIYFVNCIYVFFFVNKIFVIP